MYVFLTPEMAAMYFLGMCCIISITGDNILKGLLAGAFGLGISLIGADPISAVYRYTYHPELRGGVGWFRPPWSPCDERDVPFDAAKFSVGRTCQRGFSAKFPNLKELVRVIPRIMIGTVIGSTLGAIPGLSGTAAAVLSYQQSKLWSKHPEEYGHGSIEGLASNEAAQNASQAGEMVPTFGLGIPGSGSMVMVLAACLMHGFVPGPQMIREAPQLLYAAGGGMLISTFILVLTGWPMSLYMLKLMTLDRQLILIGCILLTMIGVFTLNNSVSTSSCCVFLER